MSDHPSERRWRRSGTSLRGLRCPASGASAWRGFKVVGEARPGTGGTGRGLARILVQRRAGGLDDTVEESEKISARNNGGHRYAVRFPLAESLDPAGLNSGDCPRPHRQRLSITQPAIHEPPVSDVGDRLADRERVDRDGEKETKRLHVHYADLLLKGLTDGA